MAEDRRIVSLEEAVKEVYERSILDKFTDAIIDLLVIILDSIRRGWRQRNQARVDEWRLMFYALNRSPPGLIGVFLITIFVVIAVIGPYMAPFSYDFSLLFCDRSTYLAPPLSTAHIGKECTIYGLKPGNYTLLLGTDDYGRDLWSRILYGARTSFIVTLLVMLVGPWIGIALGLVAGYYGGAVDETIMRIVDMFLAFPGMIFAIALSAVFPDRLAGFLAENKWLEDILLGLFALKPEHVGPLSRLVSVIVALWIVWWPGYARLVRGMVLSAKENTYVEAARALGVPTRSIMFRHILPNIMGPILVYITLDFGAVMLVEAGLSFLGLGAVPPIADWGRIVYDGAQYFPDAWWLVFFPGLAILLSVLGFNLLGDTLRDVLDPRTRRSIEFKLKKKPVGGG
ncbi:MAG: ABC transporter permease [Pyrodictiaceae archaeon]